MCKKETVSGIEYILPKVFLVGETGIGNSEMGGRTCYGSFENSENEIIRDLEEILDRGDVDNLVDDLDSIEDSELLKRLSFVDFHHSVIEHSSVSFLIKGTSRGALQEIVRHRIASYSVKSTRYTLDTLLYLFIVSYNNKDKFIDDALQLDLFVTSNQDYNKIELEGIFNKLKLQLDIIGYKEFVSLVCPAATALYLVENKDTLKPEELMAKMLEKKKRNAGDKFKHLITDNFKTNLVMTMNLRSLKNFFDMRLSGAAWFQIRWLAEEIKNTLPDKYKKLIFKSFQS